MIPPGSTIGIIGGGQLGRMLALAAAALGYRCHIYCPDADSPAAEVAARFTQNAYDDEAALARFAEAVDIVTYEFENIPAAPMLALARRFPVQPHPRALEVAQDRLDEKRFAKTHGIATAPWAPVATAAALDFALSLVGAPAILKTRRFGYDGKGQVRLATMDDGPTAWEAIGERPAILEGQVDFGHEFSIVAVRGRDGDFLAWDAPDNVHTRGVLATSTVPPGPEIAIHVEAATAIARRIADALDYVGVLACEFFATAAGPIFNEMAPRVHNSGHWTIEGALTSQFENHIRAICGLPLGATTRTSPRVEMQNLIGEAAHDWPTILADPTAHLHLYGKTDPRPGRKMGHVTRLLE